MVEKPSNTGWAIDRLGAIRPRPMKLLRIVVLAGILLPAVGAVAANAPAGKEPATLALSDKAADSQPVKIIQLRGDATAIGQQHAAALAPMIKDLEAHYLGKVLPDNLTRGLAGALAMSFESKLRPEHLAEIRALAAAVPVNEGEAMLDNTFLDLMPVVACSTMTLPADAAPDHVARFGRNLDFESFGVADKNTVVLVYHPEGRYAFATIGWPGMIGAVSGMNEFGLTLSCMEVPRGPGLVAKGMPYALLYRSVLERCKTVDEAVQLLRDTTRQTPNNLMLMDAAGRRAVVELSSDQVVVRAGQDKTALISTNHQRGQDADKPGLCDRYDYLHDTAKQLYGQLGAMQLAAMLEHVQQGDLTMESMIFEPANRVVYLATGLRAADRKFTRIDLGAYFAAPAR